MKKIFALILLSFLCQPFFAQDQLKIEFHGFLKTDYWWDSRQVVYAREGIFTLFPKDIAPDANGQDINDQGSFNFSAITTRANVKLSGLRAFDADVIGFIEGGFSGISNTDVNGFRLRHAFIKLNWEKSNLLLGQFWHPLFVTESFPRVISLNTGAPFQAFNRSPQIRYTYKIKNLNIIAAALSQRDYTSIGSQGRSFTYLSNSQIPNLHLQLRNKGKHLCYGVAVDYKSLKPRIVTSKNYKTDELINGTSYMVFAGYKKNRLQVNTKAILGQNLSEQLMLGGYAVQSLDTITGIETYTPTNHISTFANVLYDFPLKKKHNKIRLGVFTGYALNLGTTDENIGIYYASGAGIDKMLRGSGNISFISGKVQLSVELEHTVVHYGTPNNLGLVENTHQVSNNRLLFTGFYFF
jgi:hypothetical protein